MALFLGRKLKVKNVTTYHLGWGTTQQGLCPGCGANVIRYYDPKYCPTCKSAIRWPDT